MRSSLHSSDSSSLEITCTDVLEHSFCARFTYFEHVLAIPERQEKRFKVMKGREIHKKVSSINATYLRKKIGCVRRSRDVHLSAGDGLVGRIDELLTLNDGTMAPLDYKFAEYRGHLYRTHVLQVAFYGRLIEQCFEKQVTRGYLVYTRSRNKLVEVPVGDREKRLLARSVSEIKEILVGSRIPPKGASRRACMDCCYKNICDRGLEL